MSDDTMQNHTEPPSDDSEQPGDEQHHEPADVWSDSPLPDWALAVNWGGLVLALLFGLSVGALFLGGDSNGSSGSGDPGGAHASHDHGDNGGEGGGEASKKWTCSMHPQIQQDEPGQCPICGMDLIPASESDDGGEALEPDQIELGDRARKLARIRTEEVQSRDPEGSTLQLLGRVKPAETKQKTVTAWTSGRIDRLHVATTGETIGRGQVIATIYSPDIYAAHRELLVAKSQVERLSEATDIARRSARSNLESARQKLRLLGVTKSQMRRMERADSAWSSVPIRSQFGGTVMERLVDEGNYIQAGTGIYRVADLSTVWVQLDAYESDLGYIDVGQPVELTVASMPGESFKGEVAFIDPVVNPQSRTAQVRVEVENPEGRLRPGMWAEAELMAGDDQEDGPKDGKDAESSQPLVIPETAPLFSGRRSLVYVKVPGRETPTYEAREVKLGSKIGDTYPVIAGLNRGEEVVIHGAFVLDADLQIRGGKSLMTRPDDDTIRPIDRAVRTDEAFQAGIAPLFRAYLDMQSALASDDVAAAKSAGTMMKSAMADFSPKGPEKAVKVWKEQTPALAEAIDGFVRAEKLEEAREHFENLTDTMKDLLTRFGNPLDEPLKVAHCPMAFDNKGAEWLQRSDEIENAYFGKEMLRCGEIRQTVAQDSHLINRN